MSLASAAVAVALLATGSNALAAFGDFSYTTTITPAVTTGTGSELDLISVTTPQFSNAAAPGGTNSTVAFSQLLDLAPGGVYSDSYNVPYTITMTLTNTNSGGTDTFTITGSMIGTISSTDGSTVSSNFNSSTIDPILVFSKTIGDAVFTLSAPVLTPPGAPLDNGTGLVGTFVVTVSAVPEPSSIALMGLGVLGLVGVGRSLRRRSQTA